MKEGFSNFFLYLFNFDISHIFENKCLYYFYDILYKFICPLLLFFWSFLARTSLIVNEKHALLLFAYYFTLILLFIVIFEYYFKYLIIFCVINILVSLLLYWIVVCCFVSYFTAYIYLFKVMMENYIFKLQ